MKRQFKRRDDYNSSWNQENNPNNAGGDRTLAEACTVPLGTARNVRSEDIPGPGDPSQSHQRQSTSRRVNHEGSPDAMAIELEAFAGEEAVQEGEEETNQKRVLVKRVGERKKCSPLPEILCG